MCHKTLKVSNSYEDYKLNYFNWKFKKIECDHMINTVKNNLFFNLKKFLIKFW